MLLRALLLLAVVFPAASPAGAAEDLSVQTERRGEGIEVRARATVAASWETVWGTLTDYDRLAAFVPGMKASRVIARNGDTATVEQLGEAGFLFFTFPIEVTLLSTARPPEAIEVRALKGSFRRLEGAYRLRPAGPGRIELTWTGLLEPDFALPPLLGGLVLRATVEEQFTGMVREIERRELERAQRGGSR